MSYMLTVNTFGMETCRAIFDTKKKAWEFWKIIRLNHYHVWLKDHRRYHSRNRKKYIKSGGGDLRALEYKASEITFSIKEVVIQDAVYDICGKSYKLYFCDSFRRPCIGNICSADFSEDKKDCQYSRLMEDTSEAKRP